ncbi:hypothetical protein GCM10007857_30170 [Bradyrhizobium iriomotense]|uniref:Uncharacterized protein n=1 Tax=Bradyrhizobium iriomotense TaxID=441950 RepID=A0ABQ6AXN2_9BRAD|nr:hypothetical protein GCM10007857_30170 [Bradyrhizobium iriomotense]
MADEYPNAGPGVSAAEGFDLRGVSTALTVHPLPLWGRWLREAKPGEGFSPRVNLSRFEFAERDPSSGASRHLLPQGEKDEHGASWTITTTKIHYNTTRRPSSAAQ